MQSGGCTHCFATRVAFKCRPGASHASLQARNAPSTLRSHEPAPETSFPTQLPAAPCAHLHLPLHAPLQADGDAVHRDQQLPHQGLRSSHLLLHPDQEERLQAFLLFSCSQRIGASPSKIQQSSIKRPERGGTQKLTTSAAIRVATPDSILHHALFVCTAAGRLALHLAVPFANAALAATFAGVKLLTPLQITAGVQTAALRNGDAASTALQEAGVAKAAFGARGGRVATVVFLLVGAAGGAGEAAELVVLVEGAHGACRNSRWGCIWGGVADGEGGGSCKVGSKSREV